MVRAGYDQKRRSELAAFLRTRRERVTPQDVGLPPGVRRRTPGLRREEVAQLAGVGITWYTWLEQGRAIKVSTQVLDAVARVLQLGSAERWHLYRLADVPGAPSTVAAEEPLPADVLAVLDSLEPNPACVYNGRFDLLACNESYAALFPSLAGAAGLERNALWMLFTQTDPADHSMGIAPHMVAVARANYARHVGEPEWERWIEALSAASEHFAQLWAAHEVADPIPMIKNFSALDGDPASRIETRTMGFAVSGRPETRMVVFLPCTAADAAKIANLVTLGRRAVRPA